MTGLVKKLRLGARDIKRVKSGCRTCKIRHKKCDESKPSCSQCSSTGRRCDFSINPIQVFLPNLSSLPSHLLLESSSVSLFDYFRVVCVQEVALVYESPDWESLILCAIFNEKFAYHAALAISVMTRAHYSGTKLSPDASSPFDYANQQYSLAIQHLNARLEAGWEAAELAVLASVLFVNIEFLRATVEQTRRRNLIRVHVQGGLAVLQQLQNSAGRPHLLRSWEALDDALRQTLRQLEGLELMAKL